MSTEWTWRPRYIIGRVCDEGRRVLLIFLYLWALFALFQLHKSVIVEGESLVHGQVVAIINAYVFAKVMFIAERLGLGDIFPDKALIVPVLFKSAMFAATLMCFHIVEQTGLGMLRGKAIAESVPYYGAGGLFDMTAITVIIFVVLIPFYAFRELGRTIGNDTLRHLFFHPRGTAIVGQLPSAHRETTGGLS